jgi:hypothetical protein
MAPPTSGTDASVQYQVDWGGTLLAFSEVTGLNVEVQVIEYRDGLSPARQWHPPPRAKSPGPSKPTPPNKTPGSSSQPAMNLTRTVEHTAWGTPVAPRHRSDSDRSP